MFANTAKFLAVIQEPGISPELARKAVRDLVSQAYYYEEGDIYLPASFTSTAACELLGEKSSYRQLGFTFTEFYDLN